MVFCWEFAGSVRFVMDLLAIAVFSRWLLVDFEVLTKHWLFFCLEIQDRRPGHEMWDPSNFCCSDPERDANLMIYSLLLSNLSSFASYAKENEKWEIVLLRWNLKCLLWDRWFVEWHWNLETVYYQILWIPWIPYEYIIIYILMNCKSLCPYGHKICSVKYSNSVWWWMCSVVSTCSSVGWGYGQMLS